MSASRKTVLIADDDPILRSLLRETLGRRRFRLLEAADGLEAVSISRRERPDLIVLDLIMPGQDGRAVCQALKSDPSTSAIRIIVLTGGELPEHEGGEAPTAPDEILTKPFSPRELLDTIHRLLAE